jgi:hypothetical protein
MWPERDRLRFLGAQGDGDPLSGKDPTDRNARSWKALRYSYSHWLGFLMVRHPGLLDLPAEQRVCKDTVDEYMQFLAVTSKEMSISIELQRLYLVIKELAPQPEGQWYWLWIASYRLFKRAVPSERQAVDVGAVCAAGETLMRRAQQQAADRGYVSENAAITYRKGLEMFFQGTVGRRKRTWVALRLGANIMKNGPAWRLKIEREDDKSKKLSFRRAPEQLWPWIDDWVQRFRPAISGSDNHDGFWASRLGNPMSGSTNYQSLTRTTEAVLGVRVSPHELRRSVATHWYRMAPDQPDKARRHLAHSDYRITRKHYIVPSGNAGRGLLRAWEAYRPPETHGQGSKNSRGERRRTAGVARPRTAARKGNDGAAS